MRRLAWLSGALMASVLVASVAVGQEPVAGTDTVPRPFVPGGVYDKPYLTNLTGRTAIGGYAEAQARWQQADGVREGLGFELKRWNLFTATRLSEFVRIGAELEFEELAEEITLEFAAIDLTVHPALTLRAGAILSPLGRFNLAHDSPRNEFTDRPLVSTEVIGTALTEPGLGALGVFSVPGGGRATYEVYAVNGFHDGLINDSSDGTRIPAGKKNFADNNSSPAVVGRLAWSPRVGHEIGFSGHRGAYNSFVLAGQGIDARRDLSVVAIDLETTTPIAVVSGEAVAASVEIPAGLEGIYASQQRGAYVQAVREFGRGLVYTMPDSYFEAGVRYDGVDFDADLTGDSAQRLTFGLNFRPSADTVLKLNYLRHRTRDRFNNRGDGAGVLFSIATYF